MVMFYMREVVIISMPFDAMIMIVTLNVTSLHSVLTSLPPLVYL